MPEAKTIVVTILIAGLVISGLGLLNVLPVSSAYCSVWNYAGHGSPPAYAGCSGKTSGSSSSSTTTLVSSSSSSSSLTTSSTTEATSSTSTGSGVSKASLTLSSSSFSMAVGGASSSVSFVVQATGPVNLTVVGATKFVAYAYCVNLQCVQNDGVLSITSAGTFQGLISVNALSSAAASTYTSTFEAVYDNQVIASLPLSAVVGGGSSNYFCVEQSLSINVTRALINSNGQVYSSTPLQSLIGKPGTPSTPIVAYETAISGSPTPGASGSFIVTYEVLGTGPISTNVQGRVLTQGDGWKLFEFQQTIPLSGGSFNVYLNATDMLWGEYYAGLDSNTQTLLSSAGLNGNQVWILYYEAQTAGLDTVFGNVAIQGCSGISSGLQYFDDALSIPVVSTSTVTTTTTSCPQGWIYTDGACHSLRNGYSVVPLSLYPKAGFSILAIPAGANAAWIALADVLVIVGIVGAIIFAAKEYS